MSGWVAAAVENLGNRADYGSENKVSTSRCTLPREETMVGRSQVQSETMCSWLRGLQNASMEVHPSTFACGLPMATGSDRERTASAALGQIPVSGHR